VATAAPSDVRLINPCPCCTLRCGCARLVSGRYLLISYVVVLRGDLRRRLIAIYFDYTTRRAITVRRPRWLGHVATVTGNTSGGRRRRRSRATLNDLLGHYHADVSPHRHRTFAPPPGHLPPPTTTIADSNPNNKSLS